MYRLMILGAAMLTFTAIAWAQSPEKKEAQEEAEALNDKDFRAVMNALEDARDKLDKAIEGEDAERAGEQIKALEENAAKVGRYGKKDDKGAELRKEEKYQEWVKELTQRIKTLREKLDNKDWKEAEGASKETTKTCNACHKVYDPAGPW